MAQAQAQAEAQAQAQTQAQASTKVWAETVSRSLIQIATGVDNQTGMLDTLKNRQAVSGAFQAVSLAILVLWLMALATRAIYKCITKKVQADQEEMVEMLEASLARRKAKRRAMGKQTGETTQ